MWRIVFISPVSSTVVDGSAKEASIDAGVGSEPKREEDLDRFAGEGASGSRAVRFLVTRFAAASTLLACFSSVKIGWMVVMVALARLSGLVISSEED